VVVLDGADNELAADGEKDGACRLQPMLEEVDGAESFLDVEADDD
jgi:hypothetical protein